MLDNTRLRAELAHVHRTLSSVAANPRGPELVAELRREVDGTTSALLWQALFADCLRVTYCAVAADGDISDAEIEPLYEFVFSAARHYAGVMPWHYGEFAGVDEEAARAFLMRYSEDHGRFGRAAEVHWPGLMICREAAVYGEPEALERYERMMAWLISAACQIGGVNERDPRWRGRVNELDELRHALADIAEVEPPTEDLRVQAFLAPSRVFSAVQQASSIYEDDPFDVESIHAQARDSFEQMLERATDPEQHSDRGRMLLVLGDSGAGKTHLLRGFRHYAHQYGRGFVAYAQLHSASEDYARYLLHHVVDSLSRPYTGPSGERTGLHHLASGLPLLLGNEFGSEVERLCDDSWESAESVADYVNYLLDRLLRHRELSAFDPDLLRVMLYALLPKPSTTSRVYKYLRCDEMNAHDRRQIGDVTPRFDSGAPSKMIRDLGRLAFVARRASLVLMIDQAELAGFEASSIAAFRRAIDTLQGITTEVPSVVAVVACLSDLYKEVRDNLTKFATDRLERDPPIARLKINRSYEEIEAMVARRLSWLFAKAGAVHRPDTPVYPIPEFRLRSQENRRARDVLDWCHQFQSQCSAAGEIVEADVREPAAPPKELDLDQIAAAWNDAVHASGIEIPDDDGELLALLSSAALHCRDELGLTLATPPRKNGSLRLQLYGEEVRPELAIAITNRPYQAGAFAAQIDSLRRGAKNATPVAVRTVPFPRGASSDEVVSKLLKAGGRCSNLDVSTLRALVAIERFAPPSGAERVAEWRRRDRPISSLRTIADLFDLQTLRESQDEPGGGSPPAVAAPSVMPAAAPPSVMPAATPPTVRAAAVPTSATLAPAAFAGASVNETIMAPSATHAASRQRRDDAGPRRVDAPAGPATVVPAAASSAATPPVAAVLTLGVNAGLRNEPRTLELASMLRHTGILGSSGSGKTTLALNLIEQALERDVAVVLIDRKGDLAGYARADWWRTTADPARARRIAERVDVRLFTPGTRGGRPLSLPVVPELDNVPAHERDRMVQYAAQALAAMMHFGDGANDNARLAILTQAIDLLATSKRGDSIGSLISLLEQRDDELIARAGRYDDRLFRRLLQAV
jgi:GTPase SAR1 family protein